MRPADRQGGTLIVYSQPMPEPTLPLHRFAGFLYRRNIAFWALQTLGWSAYFTAQFVTALFYPEKTGNHQLGGYVAVLVVAAASGFGISSLLRYAYRALRERRPTVVVPSVLGLVYLAALLWRLCINSAYVGFMDEREMLDGWARLFAGALISTYIFLSWSTLYFGIYYYELAQRAREATLRATTLAQEAQMKMLRYQLNPHFLFNTLNAISTLVLDRDNDTANLAVTRLSAFLRYTLDQDPMKRVTLRQELEAIDLYLGIESLRFGPRLRLTRIVEPEALGALVPSLLLQPLVENALKYAIAPSETGGTLEIAGRIEGGRLVLEVADDGPGIVAPPVDGVRRGVGMANIQDRLTVLYGSAARFTHGTEAPGLRVRIEIPAEPVA